MNYYLDKIYADKEFIDTISDIIENPTVQEMKNFRQHYETNCFDHCLMASFLCFHFCKKYHLDYVSCARAAMLHDLFLYDWRKRQNGRKGLHAFTHPRTAFENASKLFNLNDKEKDIILKHMWPVTLSLPRYIESYVLTFFDKQCAMSETLDVLRNRCFQRKVFRYAYVFFSIIIFRFY